MTIAPSLTMREASQTLWDVLVVGAGPAGALAARELSRNRLKVLLVDRAKFPRGKVCGCCISGRALSILEKSGLGSLCARLGGIPLESMHWYSRGRSARIRLGSGLSLSRHAFDAALVYAAKQEGASFLPDTSVSIVPLPPGRQGADASVRLASLCQENQKVPVKARVIVAADGLGSRLVAAEIKNGSCVQPGSWIGIGAIVEDMPDFYGSGILFMACGVGGYVGLVRVEDGRVDVAAALDPSAVKHCGSPGALISSLLAENSLPPMPRGRAQSWRGTLPLTRRVSVAASTRVFIIGDAAGYVEPFTGEGIAWALSSATSVVPIVVRAVHNWRPGMINEWNQLYLRTVGRGQLACRSVTTILRAPTLTTGLVRLLAIAPQLAEPFVRYLQSPVRRGGVC